MNYARQHPAGVWRLCCRGRCSYWNDRWLASVRGAFTSEQYRYRKQRYDQPGRCWLWHGEAYDARPMRGEAASRQHYVGRGCDSDSAGHGQSIRHKRKGVRRDRARDKNLPWCFQCKVDSGCIDHAGNQDVSQREQLYIMHLRIEAERDADAKIDCGEIEDAIGTVGQGVVSGRCKRAVSARNGCDHCWRGCKRVIGTKNTKNRGSRRESCAQCENQRQGMIPFAHGRFSSGKPGELSDEVLTR